ncbi:multiubiquitin domain-containing protein [Myxococcus stipitatus]|uniref:multiubiquitin domain-containing protein n=1 Tax=Myxococcus stipitatus TaxID=83455 RepID=UPI001F1C257B|nr:multiubiquitin domain-containing protein [Myxococcus stipitatus]MCE9671829.1 multiubiquitin domain-containing protein [Myxococcus stipitatus]
MKNDEPLEYEDVGAALREDRALRPARSYRILVAQGDLSFRSVDVADPVPLGRQILASAGLDPRGGFSLFAILASGDFEDLRLDEPFDLRTRGAERFVAFQTDRDFKLTLDDDQLAWGKPAISGAALYTLAKVGKGQAVFLEVRGGEDRLISPQDLIDLTAPGIERFITGPMPARTFEIIVNARPRVVNDKRVTFEQVVQLAFPGSHEPNAVFSMTYRHAASKPHAGELGAGGSVEVKEKGTTFNVTKTVQS